MKEIPFDDPTHRYWDLRIFKPGPGRGTKTIAASCEPETADLIRQKLSEREPKRVAFEFKLPYHTVIRIKNNELFPIPEIPCPS